MDINSVKNEATKLNIAGKGERIAAGIIDAIIPAILSFGITIWLFSSILGQAENNLNSTILYHNFLRNTYIAMLYILPYGLLIAYFRFFTFDTIGKKLMKLKTTDSLGNNPKYYNIALKYYLPSTIILIPQVISYFVVPSTTTILDTYSHPLLISINFLTWMLNIYSIIDVIVYLVSNENVSLGDRIFNIRVVKNEIQSVAPVQTSFVNNGM